MSRKFVVFRVGQGHYAIPLAEVSQILRYEHVTDVPAAPPFVDGVINVGGEVIPVVNLRARLSLDRAAITRKNRVIIVQKQDIRYGLLVEGVREILDLEEDSIATEAASVFGMKPEFVLGIAKVRDYLLVLLDVFKVLSTSPEVSIKE
jgi:purine-binding chemotaxis protein CheW